MLYESIKLHYLVILKYSRILIDTLYYYTHVLKVKMVVSEKSLKRLRDFLTTSIKVKYRFSSLESFHGNI